MDLRLNTELGRGYKSKAQRNRVITEHWMAEQGYCPSCGGDLCQYVPNKPVADFYCPKCSGDYELKSKTGKMGRTVVDGEYQAMVRRISSDTAPSFFFMAHDGEQVRTLFTTPAHFVTESIIAPRKPLGKHDKRAGWQGCNILLQSIPERGRIYYILDGKENSRQQVMDAFAATTFLRTHAMKADMRGWLLDVLCCVERLKRKVFTLSDVYRFEDYLSAKHPQNRNVQAKIRQQLQLLRDLGCLRFTGRGNYELL